MESRTAHAARQLEPDLVASYRERGFVHVEAAISREEAKRYHTAATAFQAEHSSRTRSHRTTGGAVFEQFINVWRQDPVMGELTLNPELHSLAEQLAGIPLRLWHDHMLIKPPHNNAATEFHQDRPFWPHDRHGPALSAWVALVDVPVERGCMTFIPGTQRLHGLRPQDLGNEQDLFVIAPDLRWLERVTIPLKAGDCTFHNSFTAHMATPNHTDDPRFAHIVIYMDAETRFTGGEHPVTAGLGLSKGDALDGELFPRPTT